MSAGFVDPSDVVLALDNQFCFALHSAARRMERAYQPVLASFDLTYPQYLVMLVVWEWETTRHPRPTVRALGERLDLDSGTLTPLLRRLEQKGLLSRARSTDDGRELFVRVTSRGAALKKKVSAVPMMMLTNSPLPLMELVALREQLKRLRGGMTSTHARGD
ncbi:MAG TPA: MarR family transcriptional regulator [Polyangiales bacterium]